MTDPTVTARVRADAKQLISELRGAGTASKQFGKDAEQAGAQAERGANRASVAFSRVREGMTGLAGAARLVIGSLAVQKLAQFADAATLLDARLRIVSRTSEEYANAGGLVLDIAQRTRSELNSTANLYSRLTQSLKDTGASQAEVARLTETINKAFQVSGATTQEASNAITQLAQGLAAGALRGDEFNSVAEQAPAIMDALAKQLGVTRGELRAMAEDGKITADLVREALGSAAAEIDAKFAQLPPTISSSLTQLNNALQSTIGWFNEAGGASSLVVRGINLITQVVQDLPIILFGMIGEARKFWELLKFGFANAGAAIKLAMLTAFDAVKLGIAENIAALALSLAKIDAPGVRDLAEGLARTALSLKNSANGAKEYRAELQGLIRATQLKLQQIDDQTFGAQQQVDAQRAVNASTEEGIRAVREGAATDREGAAAKRGLAKAASELELALRKAFQEGLKPLKQEMQEFSALTGRVTATIVGDVPQVIKFGEAARASLERMNKEASKPVPSEFAESWVSASDAVVAAIADFASGGLKSFSDFASAMKNIARRLVSDLIYTFLRNRIVVPITAQITGQGGGIAGAAGQAAGLGGGIGNILGLAGGAAGLLGGLGGLGTGLTASAGIFGSAGLIGGFTGSISAGFASLAGGAIGQGIGLLAGPIGLAVAALSLLAGALKDTTRRITVIGSELVGTPGYQNLAPDARRDSALGGFAFASIDNVSREQRDQLAQAIQQFDASIAQLLSGEQLDRVRSAIATLNTQATEGAITAETFIGRRFDAILSTMDQSVQDFVRAGSGFEEQMRRLGEALARPAEIQALLDGLTREDMLASMTELERRTFEVNERFDQAIAYLTERAASEEQLAQVEQFRARALAALTDATEGSIDSIVRDGQGLARMLSQLRFDESLIGLSDLDRALALLARELGEAIVAAQGMGATEAELAEIRDIYAARRTRIERQASEQALDAAADYWAQIAAFNQQGAQQAADAIRNAFGGLADFLRGEVFSETSTLTPAQQFAAAQEQFQDILRRAAGGDTNAAAGIQGAAQQLLQQGLSFLGGGDAWRQLREAVLGALSPLAALGQSGSADGGALAGGPAAALRRFLELMRGFGLGQLSTGGGSLVGPLLAAQLANAPAANSIPAPNLVVAPAPAPGSAAGSTGSRSRAAEGSSDPVVAAVNGMKAALQRTMQEEIDKLGRRLVQAFEMKRASGERW